MECVEVEEREWNMCVINLEENPIALVYLMEQKNPLVMYILVLVNVNKIVEEVLER
jgi:hypothetical protein